MKYPGTGSGRMCRTGSGRRSGRKVWEKGLGEATGEDLEECLGEDLGPGTGRGYSRGSGRGSHCPEEDLGEGPPDDRGRQNRILKTR